jgi:hypothetical protein
LSVTALGIHSAEQLGGWINVQWSDCSARQLRLVGAVPLRSCAEQWQCCYAALRLCSFEARQLCSLAAVQLGSCAVVQLAHFRKFVSLAVKRIISGL